VATRSPPFRVPSRPATWHRIVVDDQHRRFSSGFIFGCIHRVLQKFRWMATRRWTSVCPSARRKTLDALCGFLRDRRSLRDSPSRTKSSHSLAIVARRVPPKFAVLELSVCTACETPPTAYSPPRFDRFDQAGMLQVQVDHRFEQIGFAARQCCAIRRRRSAHPRQVAPFGLRQRTQRQPAPEHVASCC